MLFIRCNTLPPPVDRGLNGPYPESRSVLSDGLFGRKLNVPSTGVIGVALRDLTIGKGGNAESCDIVMSGEGGPIESGVVALLEGF